MENLKFRTKLLLCFFALALVNAAIFTALSMTNAKKSTKFHIRSNALSIAASAAEQIDGDLHEQIKNEGDESTAAYRELESRLREIRDANRRDDVYVKFIYTLRRTATEPDKWIYVVDAEEAGDDKSSIGEVLEWEEQGTEDDEPLKLGEAYADEGFVTDEYGTWLSANAPIRNSAGEIVGMLGVDFKASDVIAETNRVVRNSLLGLLLTLSLTGIVAVVLSQWISKPLKEIVAGLTKIGRGHLEYKMDDMRGDEFGEINRTVNVMSQSLLERDALQGALSRYVSQETVQKLIKDGEFPTFRGHRKKMTILLCNIVNLESLSEEISPGKLVEMLNAYFDRLVGVIFKHNGTIDQLPGDGLSAVFGALGDEKQQEKLAVQAGVELITENDQFNEKWGFPGSDGFQLQIGIHSGEAIFGNIGSDHRVEFTVVGKSMKIASALGDLNEQFKTQILVSETTQKKIAGDFPFIEIGEVQPGPKADPLHLFTLTSLLPPDVVAKIESIAAQEA